MIRALAEREMRPPGGIRVPRPAGDGRTVEIAAVRTGTGRGTPVLMILGGPGVASVVPYRGLRKLAARRKLDVLMVEHRGVGLSRTDITGVDLAVEQVTLENAADDLAAVLDAAGVERAVVYGTSYGSYLAHALTLELATL